MTGRPTFPNPGTKAARDKRKAQDKVLEYLEQGYTVDAACKAAKRSRKAYDQWRATDPDFRNRAEVAKQLRKVQEGVLRGEFLPFEAWRTKYLQTPTYWHQQQWIDVIEDRPPRDLHPAQTYVPADPNRILILTPPGHAKTQTLSVDYVTYRLCMDPSFRVLIVSAGASLAQAILFGVQQRLTSPECIDLQRAYAPDGGWEATAESWTQTAITFSSDLRATGQHGSGEKDPNVQALGIGGKIYGRRADLIIVDDAVDLGNVSQYEKQFAYLNREVDSRLTMAGKMIVVGTRIASVDLYSHMLDPESFGGDESPWTHLASPAILEEGSTPAEHKTLWPYAQVPWGDLRSGFERCACRNAEQCWGEPFDIAGIPHFPRWDGTHLEMGPRKRNTPQQFALIYQQQSVASDATFPEFAVAKAVNGFRMPGLLQQNMTGHPLGGMRGKYVIAGCDPSVKGYAAIIVLAVDKETGKRYVLSAINLKAPTPEQLKNKMFEVTDHYGVQEWRVEKTGLLQFFTQDQKLRSFMAGRGVIFKEHSTNAKTKWDPAYGVASMSPLFGQYDRATGPHGEITSEWREISPPLIELPKLMLDGLKQLVHQLIVWTPDLNPERVPCDLVMALWFAEIGAREITRRKVSSDNIASFRRARRFTPKRDMQHTFKVDLREAAMSEGPWQTTSA